MHEYIQYIFIYNIYVYIYIHICFRNHESKHCFIVWIRWLSILIWRWIYILLTTLGWKLSDQKRFTCDLGTACTSNFVRVCLCWVRGESNWGVVRFSRCWSCRTFGRTKVRFRHQLPFVQVLSADFLRPRNSSHLRPTSICSSLFSYKFQKSKDQATLSYFSWLKMFCNAAM